MDNQLRVAILKMEKRLSDDDRVRFHFYFGNHVPRIVGDNLSLRGTLSLIESLFDQDKINEKDFTILINALDEIQCSDAANLLREHRRRIASTEFNQSLPSLALIMPSKVNKKPSLTKELLRDQEEDEYVAEHLLDNQQNINGDNNATVSNDNVSLNSALVVVSDQKAIPERSRKKHMVTSSSVFRKYCLLFTLLLIIVSGILVYLIIRNRNQTPQPEIKNNQSIVINQQSTHEQEQLKDKETIPTATVCPPITCSAISSVDTPSLNYQVERLDFNCSQSLSNLAIIQVVQRTYKEIHAKQYQTFWNYTTNMTYVHSPTQIIYTWYSLPEMNIDENGFPYFVEAQFYFKNGSTRVTSSDTWQISLQSICGDFLNLSGTF